MLHLQERRVLRAAESYRAAVLVDPESLDAPAWMDAAARAYRDGGDHVEAQRQWSELLARHDAWRGRANLGLAELHLAQRQIAPALRLFEDTAQHGLPDEQAAARLGISVCLEKLGDLDQALAAIDGAQLPDQVRRSRTYALRARQAWTN